MQTETKKPMAVAPSGGRRILVLGNEIRLKLATYRTNGEYFVFEAVTPPGAGVPLKVHRSEDELLRVLDGEFEIQLDRQIQKVMPGAVVYFPRGVPHPFRNIGMKPGTTFWTILPGASFEKFFEELGNLPVGGEPSMAKVAEIFNKHDINLLPR